MGGGISDTNPQIEGGTDGTVIGNTGDRLKVDASVVSSIPPKISKKLRSVIDKTSQAITGSSFVTIFTYTGSGDFWSFIVATNQNGAQLRLEIDGEVILDGAASVTDIQFSLPNATSQTFAGGHWCQSFTTGGLAFSVPYPIAYTTNVVLKAKRDNNGNITVNQVQVNLTKET